MTCFIPGNSVSDFLVQTSTCFRTCSFEVCLPEVVTDANRAEPVNSLFASAGLQGSIIVVTLGTLRTVVGARTGSSQAEVVI